MPPGGHRAPKDGDQPDRDDHPHDFPESTADAPGGCPQCDARANQDDHISDCVDGARATIGAEEYQALRDSLIDEVINQRLERAERTIVIARRMFREGADPVRIREILNLVSVNETYYEGLTP